MRKFFASKVRLLDNQTTYEVRERVGRNYEFVCEVCRGRETARIIARALEQYNVNE